MHLDSVMLNKSSPSMALEMIMVGGGGRCAATMSGAVGVLGEWHDPARCCSIVDGTLESAEAIAAYSEREYTAFGIPRRDPRDCTNSSKQHVSQ